MISVGVRSHERRNELVPVWNFKPTWKQVLLTWRFFSAAFQNDPIFWWICVGISFWVVVTWYLIIRNEILFLLKWPQWNNTCNDFQAYMRIKRNIQRIFAVYLKISCRLEISFRSKWPIWNPYRLEFHFPSIHVNTNKGLTEHRSEIFNWYEISYRIEFISLLMWTYSSYAATITWFLCPQKLCLRLSLSIYQICTILKYCYPHLY